MRILKNKEKRRFHIMCKVNLIHLENQDEQDNKVLKITICPRD